LAHAADNLEKTRLAAGCAIARVVDAVATEHLATVLSGIEFAGASFSRRVYAVISLRV